MKPEIEALVKRILDEYEFDEANALAHIYNQEEDPLPVERFFKLDGKIGVPLPSHTHYPIEYRSAVRSINFYCKVEIKRGIVFPRNFVANVCAHLESCAKLLLKKLEPTACTNIPLGPVLTRLGQLSVTEDLILKVMAFNKLVYARAKHDWNIPENEHLFGVDDAVIIYFAARKLAKQLLTEGKIEIPLKCVKQSNAAHSGNL